jgi:hypothetical protein
MPIKLMAVSRRRLGLTRAEYFQRMERYFAGMACAESSKIQLCVQNQVLDGAYGSLTDSSRQQIEDHDGVVEIYFDNFQDMIMTLNPAKQPDIPLDGRSFTDESTNIVMLAEEEVIPVENAVAAFPGATGFVHSSGAFKVMHYIMRDEEVYPEDFYLRWRDAHVSAFDKSPFLRERLRRMIASKRSRFSDNEVAARKHYGLPPLPVYDLAVSMWFDTAEDAGAFRQYLDMMQSSKTRFADWSKSFFLYTRTAPILSHG